MGEGVELVFVMMSVIISPFPRHAAGNKSKIGFDDFRAEMVPYLNQPLFERRACAIGGAVPIRLALSSACMRCTVYNAIKFTEFEFTVG